MTTETRMGWYELPPMPVEWLATVKQANGCH